MRNELPRHQLYKLEGITTMENDGVDFTVDIPDAFLFHFAALVLTPTVQEATADAGEQHLDEDDIDLVIRPALSSRKPKSKPGPKTKSTADQVSAASYTSYPAETSIYDCVQIGGSVICNIWPCR